MKSSALFPATPGLVLPMLLCVSCEKRYITEFRFYWAGMGHN